jgi:hypothetical protein
MAIYIHPENQKLLWNTIQKNAKFHQLPFSKEDWFSNTIKSFYERVQYKNLTHQELMNLNRQTIAYMMEDIQLHLSERPKFTESKKMVNEFSVRQQEYENALKPKIPPVADFSEKISDDTIQNMDELLQQQIRQRDYDVEKAKELLPPPPPHSSSTSSTPPPPADDIIKRINNVEEKIDQLHEKMEKLFEMFSQK